MLTDINSKVNCGSVKYVIRPLVGALPAWFRFAQCLRRYWSTRKKFPHLVNAGKYSTSFFVIFFSSVANGIRGELTVEGREKLLNASQHCAYVRGNYMVTLRENMTNDFSQKGV